MFVFQFTYHVFYNLRKLFVSNSHEYLIRNYSISDFHPKAEGMPRVVCNLSFSHPTVSLMFYVQKQSHVMKKDYFNFERTDGLGDDTITSCTLLFNAQRREKPRDPLFWSTIQSDLYFPKTISNGLYAYSFAIDAVKWFPTGSCNFSRMDEVSLDITLPTVDAHGKQFGQASVSVFNAHHNASSTLTNVHFVYIVIYFWLLTGFFFLHAGYPLSGMPF